MPQEFEDTTTQPEAITIPPAAEMEAAVAIREQHFRHQLATLGAMTEARATDMNRQLQGALNEGGAAALQEIAAEQATVNDRFYAALTNATEPMQAAAVQTINEYTRARMATPRPFVDPIHNEDLVAGQAAALGMETAAEATARMARARDTIPTPAQFNAMVEADIAAHRAARIGLDPQREMTQMRDEQRQMQAIPTGYADPRRDAFVGAVTAAINEAQAHTDRPAPAAAIWNTATDIRPLNTIEADMRGFAARAIGEPYAVTTGRNVVQTNYIIRKVDLEPLALKLVERLIDHGQPDDLEMAQDLHKVLGLKKLILVNVDDYECWWPGGAILNNEERVEHGLEPLEDLEEEEMLDEEPDEGN